MRIQAHANRHLDKMSEIERTELVELSAVLDEYAPVLPLSRHASPAVAVAVVPQPIAEQSSSGSGVHQEDAFLHRITTCLSISRNWQR